MNLHELVSELIRDTRGAESAGSWLFSANSSLGMFGPELLLCITIVAVLLARLLPIARNLDSFWFALTGSVLAFFVAEPWQLLSDPDGIARVPIFTGMLVHDGFTVMMRGILMGFLVLFMILTRLSGIPARGSRTDIYVLILGASLGFCLMVSANHLLIVFLALEMASVPSYAMAGMIRQSRMGSEAALKYAVYGAGTAGIMLYGISMVAGLANSAHLPTVAYRLAEQMPTMAYNELTVLALGCLMICIGLAFKLSAVPFHFWCPDVFEGTTAEVGGFLSVASKAAALALLVRVALGLGTIPPEMGQFGPATVVASQDNRPPEAPSLRVNDANVVTKEIVTMVSHSEHVEQTTQTSNNSLAGVRTLIGWIIGVLAIMSCTFGNLAAYSQTNMKRMLAYSTIAHAGYMMMAVPALLALVNTDVRGAQFAAAGLMLYIVVYLFMNLGAFTIVAFLRNRIGSECIADYSGLLRAQPIVAICFSAILLSLVGLPPLSGFIGKFAIFASLMDGFRFTGQPLLILLLVVGGLNSTVSLFYYLRVVRCMVMQPTSEAIDRSAGGFWQVESSFICLLTIPTAALIVAWEPLMAMAVAAAQSLIT